MSRSLVVVPGSRPLRLVERGVLAGEILATYGLVRRSQARSTLPETVQYLRDVETDARCVEQPVRTARRLGRAVIRTISPLPGDSRCLVRSLVLTRLLARRGIEGRLVVGVTSPAGFEAHAWVELDGVPVLDPGPPRFERLVEL
jgi:hypothetical protein